MRAAVQQCRIDSPRKCMVYLSSDSAQVDLAQFALESILSLSLQFCAALVSMPRSSAENMPDRYHVFNLNRAFDQQAIQIFRERLSEYGLTTVVAPGQVIYTRQSVCGAMEHVSTRAVTKAAA